MSRERLEDVRETMAYIEMCEKEMFNQEQADMAKCYLIERHGDWLIEQAERLEAIIKHRNDILKANEYLNEQNKRYKQALEFYSDIELYDEYDHPELGLTTDVNIDKGKRARKALEGDSNEPKQSI